MTEQSIILCLKNNRIYRYVKTVNVNRNNNYFTTIPTIIILYF